MRTELKTTRFSSGTPICYDFTSVTGPAIGIPSLHTKVVFPVPASPMMTSWKPGQSTACWFGRAWNRHAKETRNFFFKETKNKEHTRTEWEQNPNSRSRNQIAQLQNPQKKQHLTRIHKLEKNHKKNRDSRRPSNNKNTSYPYKNGHAENGMMKRKEKKST